MNNKLKTKNKKQDINDSRRNLTKASATLPFLMSFSRPLWAAGDCQPSDIQSGNLSVRPNDKNCFGLGMSAVFFLSSDDKHWSGIPRSQPFNDTFGLPVKIKVKDGEDIDEPTFQQVLEAKETDIKPLDNSVEKDGLGVRAKDSIAAYLSALLNPNFFGKVDPADPAVTPEQVIADFDAHPAISIYASFVN